MKQKPRRRASLALASCAGVGAFVVVLASCGDSTYVYLARKYDESRDCLTGATSVDVLAGDPPASNCEAVCLVTTESLATAAGTYVSTECPPYPPRATMPAAGSNATCTRALAAQSRGDYCNTDGGSTKPVSRADAGSDSSD